MISGNTVSITTGSMNRLAHLRMVLPSWLALPEVDEILIVDWGSEPALLESLQDFTDPRICIARVAGRRYWENARCHNLEFRLASGDWLLRLDNDHLLREDFFRSHIVEPGVFYAGNWRPWAEGRDEKRNLSGILLVERNALFHVNGYNERLIHYGVEDDDVYERLTAFGVERRDLVPETAEHIHHADIERYKNLRLAAEHPEFVDDRNRRWDERIDNMTAVKRRIREISLDINRRSPWTVTDRMTSWVCHTIDRRVVMVEEGTDETGRLVLA